MSAGPGDAAAGEGEASSRREAADGVPTLAFALDTAFRYVAFNAAHAAVMKAIYGADIELGAVMLDYMTVAEDRETAWSNLERAIAGEDLVEEALSGDSERTRHHFRVTHSAMRSGGTVVGVMVLAEDITHRLRAERQLSRETERGTVLLELHRNSTRLDDRELSEFALDRAVQLTGSELGFFHVVSPDQRDVILTCWNRAALGTCTASYDTHYPIEEAGNWVDCVRLRRPVVYNDYAASPNQRGLPEGHAPIHRFLSCPVLDGDTVQIIIGVANKPDPYDDTDVVQLELVANELSKLLRQHAADEAQLRLNRELRAISRCNEVLIRATDEQALLDDICRIVCDEAGYRMAWVGYVEHDEAKTIRPVASAGAFAGELEGSGITWAETPRGMGPTGVAARTGLASFIQNLETDPLGAPWRDDARRYGRRAAIALPLKGDDGVTFGALSICTAEETFSADEIHLLEELAGDLAFGIGVIRARTAQRDLEAQLRQSQKLETVGQLAGGIAHDFNNLLTAIRGYSEFLGSELLPSQEGARSDLGEVLAAVDRAEVLTRQLLAFSRRQMLQPRVVIPGDVVERIVPMLRRVLGEQVELVTHLRRDTGSARVDPGQLEQVIVNLAVNARDAMPEGGRLEIGTDVVEVGPDEAAAHIGATPGWHVVLAVTDSGVGMDAATQAHMFEPFFTTKSEGKGSGLGLATVYGIVRQSGGFITVLSEPDEGSVFRVFLPRITAPEYDVAQAGGGDPEPPARGTGTILLVEDDPAVRAFASRALERLGYLVLHAPGGADALGLAAAHPGPIDLLLTDTVMPGMQGPEVARRVIAARPGTPCLFMSGFTDKSPGAAELLKGAPFLAKPFTISDLAIAVRDALAPPGSRDPDAPNPPSA